MLTFNYIRLRLICSQWRSDQHHCHQWISRKWLTVADLIWWQESHLFWFTGLHLPTYCNLSSLLILILIFKQYYNYHFVLARPHRETHKWFNKLIWKTTDLNIHAKTQICTSYVLEYWHSFAFKNNYLPVRFFNIQHVKILYVFFKINSNHFFLHCNSLWFSL